jgi:sugar lactone lactonase YvrE
MMGDDGSFKNPEVVVDKTGMANGLAFSPDESVLYYTETLDGLWSFDMKTREKRKVYSPGPFFHVVDDVTADESGALWVCWNSGLAVVRLRDGREAAYRVGDLKAPSSCQFGRGRGFRPDFLYITEFGLKGRSFTMDGRGVWVLPVSDLER